MMRKRTVCPADPAETRGTYNPYIYKLMKAIRFLLLPLAVLAITSADSLAKFDEKSALAVLASDSEMKARACQALAVHGGPDSVPALAEFLGNFRLASYARTALEVIEDPSAGEALHAALPNLEGRLLAGVVTSLGVRGDKVSVPSLQELATNSDKSVAGSAITALAHIGTKNALATVIQALKQGPADLRISAAHAALAAAEKMANQGNENEAEQLLESVRAAAVPEHIKQATQG